MDGTVRSERGEHTSLTPTHAYTDTQVVLECSFYRVLDDLTENNHFDGWDYALALAHCAALPIPETVAWLPFLPIDRLFRQIPT